MLQEKTVLLRLFRQRAPRELKSYRLSQFVEGGISLTYPVRAFKTYVWNELHFFNEDLKRDLTHAKDTIDQ